MKKLLVSLAALALFFVAAAAPAAGDNGAGELNASFYAGASGGVAIDWHSEVADGVASPQINPEGRLEPFGAPEFICDQLLVGTWVFVSDPYRAELDAFTNEFKLDGVVLDTVRTPNKRVAGSDWWFAEGVPVLGVLEPGVHEIEWSYDGFGTSETFHTTVYVDSAYC